MASTSTKKRPTSIIPGDESRRRRLHTTGRRARAGRAHDLVRVQHSHLVLVFFKTNNGARGVAVGGDEGVAVADEREGALHGCSDPAPRGAVAASVGAFAFAGAPVVAGARPRAVRSGSKISHVACPRLRVGVLRARAPRFLCAAFFGRENGFCLTGPVWTGPSCNVCVRTRLQIELGGGQVPRKRSGWQFDLDGEGRNWLIRRSKRPSGDVHGLPQATNPRLAVKTPPRRIHKLL